jgi:hypothetical protein
MEVYEILGLSIAVVRFYFGMSASSQVTQLKYEHTALKKNLKDLGVFKKEQEPEKK